MAVDNFLFIDGIRLYVFFSQLYIYVRYLSHLGPVALCIKYINMYLSRCFELRKELEPFLSNIYIIRAKRTITLTAFAQPETNMALCFEGAMYCDDNSGYYKLPDAVINTQYNDTRKFRIAAGTSLVIVNFRMGALGAFFNFPQNKYEQSLTDVLYVQAGLLQLLQNADTDKARITAVEDFLCRHLNEKNADMTMMSVADHIRLCKGSLKISGLYRSAYLSGSQFERRFRKSAGCSAKKYASLIRLQKIITGETAGDDITDKAYEAGYFDQSHFIRDFKAYTGHTPKRFFKIQKHLQVQPVLGLADYDNDSLC